MFHAVACGGATSANAVRTIQQFAAVSDLVPVLKEQGHAWRSGSTTAQAFATIARDAITLFGTETKQRLRACRNTRCPLLFVDTSRPGRRAWCRINRCGNLQKTERYRRRKTTGGANPP